MPWMERKKTHETYDETCVRLTGYKTLAPVRERIEQYFKGA